MVSSEDCARAVMWYPTYAFVDSTVGSGFGWCFADSAASQLRLLLVDANCDSIDYLECICAARSPPPAPPRAPPSKPSPTLPPPTSPPSGPSPSPPTMATTMFVGTVQTECGTALSVRSPYNATTSDVLWVHEDDDGAVALYASHSFPTVVAAESIVRDASTDVAIEVVSFYGNTYLKVNGQFAYTHARDDTHEPHSPPWTLLLANGNAVQCPLASPPPSPSPCVAENTCIDLLDSMHTVSTCADIILVGVLTCTSPEIQDANLCDKTCGVCQLPPNLCASPNPGAPPSFPSPPSPPSPPTLPPSPPLLPPTPSPPPAPPAVPGPHSPPAPPPESPPPPSPPP